MFEMRRGERSLGRKEVELLGSSLQQWNLFTESTGFTDQRKLQDIFALIENILL